MGSLTRLTRKLRTVTAHELWMRASQKVQVATERAIDAVAGGSSVGIGTSLAWRNAAGLVNAPFFDGAEHLKSTIACLSATCPADRENVLARAEEIARGSQWIFGHGWVPVGVPPRWHEEPISGIVAPQIHWSRIHYLDSRVVGDHKILWEFNRHQHFITLGQAWAYTRDERWAELFASHVRSWIAENPPRRGVNWASSLEVAYRAISWCWALELFRDSEALTDELRKLMVMSLDAHGLHVARYLSTYFSPNTHLTGEALGLFYLGTCLPFLPSAASWRRLGAGILEEQIQRQVHEDGVYFEQATQYHRYTTEIYLHFVELAKVSNWPVDRRVTARLELLFDVLSALRRPDGTMPLLGDDDGGRLMQFDDARPEELDGLLCAGAVALSRPALLEGVRLRPEMTSWLLGSDAVGGLTALCAQREAAAEPFALAFRVGGVYVIREGEAKGHAVVSCGPHGALSCGHAHADALSVVLFGGSGELFADAGTFTYVGSARDEFRSVAGHNTLEIGSQSPSIPSGPFGWLTRTDAHLEDWKELARATWFSGYHAGYGSTDQPVRHRRSILHPDEGIWVFDDTVDSSELLQSTLRWRCAPSVEVSIASAWQGGGRFDFVRDSQLVASMVVTGREGIIDVSAGSHSGQYGSRVPTSICSWRGPIGRNFGVRSVVIDWTVSHYAAVDIGLDGGQATVRLGSSDPSASRAIIPSRNAPVNMLDVVGHACSAFVGSRDGIRASRVVGSRFLTLQLENVEIVAGEPPRLLTVVDRESDSWVDKQDPVARKH